MLHVFYMINPFKPILYKMKGSFASCCVCLWYCLLVSKPNHRSTGSGDNASAEPKYPGRRKHVMEPSLFSFQHLRYDEHRVRYSCYWMQIAEFFGKVYLHQNWRKYTNKLVKDRTCSGMKNKMLPFFLILDNISI